MSMAPMMRIHGRILAVRHSWTHWEVWFEGNERITALGRTPTDAIHKLCGFFGTDQFVIEDLVRVDSEVETTHQEFRIPFRSNRRAPRPSLN